MLVTKLLGKFKDEVYRLELSDTYKVNQELESFKKYMNGEITEDKKTINLFKNILNTGKKIIRLHALPETFTDYLKYEIDHGYIPQSKVGALIYIISKKECEMIIKEMKLKFNPIDHFIFDKKQVVEMKYDDKGSFLEEKEVLDPDKQKSYIKLKQKLLEKAVPLDIWLKENPNYNK